MLLMLDTSHGAWSVRLLWVPIPGIIEINNFCSDNNLNKHKKKKENEKKITKWKKKIKGKIRKENKNPDST